MQTLRASAIALPFIGLAVLIGLLSDPSLLPREVFYGVAASRYPEVLIRESAALGAATILVGALAAIVVRRRRPE